jgi:hypothetical protein
VALCQSFFFLFFKNKKKKKETVIETAFLGMLGHNFYKSEMLAILLTTTALR